MPIYTVQGPDGKVYDVEGPAGATAEQLGAFISSQQTAPTSQAAQPSGSSPLLRRPILEAQLASAQATANQAREVKYGKKTYLFEASSPELEKVKAQLSALADEESRQKADTGDLWDKIAHWGRVAGSAALRGASTLPAMAAAAGKAEPRASDLQNPDNYSPAAPVESASNLGTKPKTAGEKYLASGLEGATAALAGPGGGMAPVRNAIIGGSSGIGSEASAQAFDDTALSRVLGAILGGAVPATAAAVTPNATKLLRQATSQIPEADWRRAGRLDQTLTDNGISHLSSQLLGDRSTLADLVAVTATHPTTRPMLTAAVENSPEQARKAFERFKNSNLPIAVDETKSVLSDIQQTATDRINKLRGDANAAYASNLPPGISSDTYSPADIALLVNNLRTVAANPNKFGPLTAGGNFISGLADDVAATVKPSKLLGPNGQPMQLPVEKGYVNNLLKDLNTRAEAQGYKGLPLEDAKAAIREATPEFQAARDAKSTVMVDQVNPAQQGLTGQLAQMGGGVRPDRFTAKQTALDMVFPKDIRQPDAIRELGNQLGGEAVGELLREHLSRSMERTVKLTGEAGRMQQPFDFLRDVAGTNAQRQNLEAALQVNAEALGANPAAVRNGFYKLMQAFNTMKNLKLPASVDRTVLQQQAGLNVPGLVVAPQSRLGRFLWEKATEKTFKQIAEIVTSKDGLQQLEALAKTKGNGPAGAYARSILQSTMSPEAEQDSP